jgi:hypothetical protein
MNESNLTQLKIIVERAVRPVRASTSRKRKMREELLAHVVGVFDEESAKLGDDRAALERTALRFGNPSEVTGQLQASVPASDGILQFLEGRPEESTLRGALRFAWLETVILLFVTATLMFVAGWHSAWSREELIALVLSGVFLPFWLLGPLWLVGIAFFSHWMEKSLHGPEPLTGWPRIGLIKLFNSAWAVPAVRVALIVGGLSLLMLLCFRAANWPTHAVDWYHLTLSLAAVPFAGIIAAFSVLCSWFLVQTMAERRRYHAEWSRLPIEPYS